jgi:quinoprotein relay system zinc metallohydrolase 2
MAAKKILLCFYLTMPWFILEPATALATEPFHLTEVAEGIYIHQGVHELWSAANHGDISNNGFIIGKTCVAVLDTGGSLQVGQALRAAIKEKTATPICYVINSHLHPDHVLGNAAFKADKPTYIGPAGLVEDLAHNQDYFLKNFMDPAEKTTGNWLIPPDRTVESTLELDLGGRMIRLTTHPKAHTAHDLSVYDKNTKTLWLSDLLFIERIPALEDSIKGWLSVIEGLRSTDARRVIPGHGPPSAPWPQALDAENRYLNTLVTEIRALIVKGGTLEEALETAGYSEKDRWRLFDEYHKRNVTRTFAELEWE